MFHSCDCVVISLRYLFFIDIDGLDTLHEVHTTYRYFVPIHLSFFLMCVIANTGHRGAGAAGGAGRGAARGVFRPRALRRREGASGAAEALPQGRAHLRGENVVKQISNLKF